MLCLVTGCAGFIGAHLAEALVAAGHGVHGIDSVDSSYDPALKRWRIERLCRSAAFRFLEADILDRAVLAPVFKGRFDVVFHLAARAGVRASVEDPRSYLETNILGTLNVLDQARASGSGSLILASTSSVYGDGGGPFREDAETARPLSPYAASKMGAEALCHSYHHLHGMNVTVLRFFTVYGPAGRPDMSIFRFVRWITEGEPVVIYGDGSQQRDFTYVGDIVRGTIAAQKLTGYHVLNLGSDAPVRVLDVIRKIEALTEKKARLESRPRHAADVRSTHADITRAKRLLDWEPRVSIAEGLARSVEWYEENRRWARELSC